MPLLGLVLLIRVSTYIYSLIFFRGHEGTGLSDRRIHLLIANFLVGDNYLAEKGSIFHICLWRGQKVYFHLSRNLAVGLHADQSRMMWVPMRVYMAFLCQQSGLVFLNLPLIGIIVHPNPRP